MKNKGTSIIMIMMFIIIILLVCVIGVMSFGSLDNLRSSIVEMLGGTMASTEEAVVAAPTEEPTAEPTEEPTATPTEEPTAEPTEEPTAEPTEEPTATPTEEPTAEPTEEPTAEPTEEPTATPTEEPTVEPTQKPAPEPALASVTGAGTLSFEQFGAWKRGDQPYGTFAQSSAPVHGGSFSGKLNYDFSKASASDDYVIFTQSIATSGSPNLVQAWVNGDDSGHLFNIWIEDKNGEVWAVPMGTVNFTGWQQMTGAIDANAPWPGGHVYGPDNGTIDYPIRFQGLVVDRTNGPKTGTLSFDDITFSEGAVPATPASAATSTSCPTIEGAFQVVCYDIEGSTVDQLFASIDKNTPDPGAGLIIYTTAFFPWKWEDGQGNCDLSMTTVSNEISVSIARWNQPVDVPADIVSAWEKYSEAAIERARLRTKLWNDRYKEMESAIKGATCATANDVGDSTYSKIRNEINAQVDAAIPRVEFFGRR